MAEPRNERRPLGSDVEQRPRTERELTRTRPGGTLLGRGFGDPFSMINTLHREMDRMFDNFGFNRDVDRSLWSPQIEMFEKEGKLHICADLPGLDKKDIRVELKDDVLTIDGERRGEQRDEKGGWSERSYGRFFRSIPLPEGVNAENANAKFENGVLDISFDAPKIQQNQKGRQIEIK